MDVGIECATECKCFSRFPLCVKVVVFNLKKVFKWQHKDDVTFVCFFVCLFDLRRHGDHSAGTEMQQL